MKRREFLGWIGKLAALAVIAPAKACSLLEPPVQAAPATSPPFFTGIGVEPPLKVVNCVTRLKSVRFAMFAESKIKMLKFAKAEPT